jgi:hypothetical protein
LRTGPLVSSSKLRRASRNPSLSLSGGTGMSEKGFALLAIRKRANGENIPANIF